MSLLAVAVFAGLVLLYLLAQISGEIFKIRKNSFYSYFHFVGGGLTYLFWQSLIPNWFYCLLLTGLVGVLWEIYEYVDWRFFRKQKRFKPEDKDTLNDLVMDLLGGLVVVIILRTGLFFELH